MHLTVSKRSVDGALLGGIRTSVRLGMMQDLVHGSAQQLIRVVAEQSCGSGVDERRPPLAVESVNPFAGPRQNERMLALKLRQRSFCLLALRCIPNDPAIKGPVGILPGGQGELDWKFGPVFLEPVQLDDPSHQAAYSRGGHARETPLVRLAVTMRH